MPQDAKVLELVSSRLISGNMGKRHRESPGMQRSLRQYNYT